MHRKAAYAAFLFVAVLGTNNAALASPEGDRIECAARCLSKKVSCDSHCTNEGMKAAREGDSSYNIGECLVACMDQDADCNNECNDRYSESAE
jgi:hypothetical protein